MFKICQKNPYIIIACRIPKQFITYEICYILSKVGIIYGVPEHLIDENICINVINHDASRYKFIPDNFKTEKMTLLALSKRPLYDCTTREILNYMPRHNRTESFYMEAIFLNKFVVRYLDCNYEYYIKHLKSWGLLKDIPVQLRNYNMCRIAVKRRGISLEHTPDEWKTLELCIMAVKQSKKALNFVPSCFKTQCQN